MGHSDAPNHDSFAALRREGLSKVAAVLALARGPSHREQPQAGFPSKQASSLARACMRAPLLDDGKLCLSTSETRASWPHGMTALPRQVLSTCKEGFSSQRRNFSVCRIRFPPRDHYPIFLRIVCLNEKAAATFGLQLLKSAFLPSLGGARPLKSLRELPMHTRPAPVSRCCVQPVPPEARKQSQLWKTCVVQVCLEGQAIGLSA